MNKQIPTIYQERINKYLTTALAQNPAPNSTLQHALEYTLLSGGKRLRAALVYATAELINYDAELLLDDIAASIEIIHCYSLIHDDLPAMDDDNMRRGLPSCHVKFSEAMAILTGDALHTLAFEILSKSDEHSHIRLKLINILTKAAGARGMIGGQAIDIEAENKNLSQPELEHLHRLKTGALISAAIMMPVFAASNMSNEQIKALQQFSENIGFLFQIHDDIDDYKLGSDYKRKLTTYPTLFGIDNAKIFAKNLFNQTIGNLDNFFKLKESSLIKVAQVMVPQIFQY